MTEAKHTACHWHRAEDGTTTLIPGCWGRVHDPDAECTCRAWSEDTARESLRNMQAAVYRERHLVQTLRAALRNAGLPEYPGDTSIGRNPKDYTARQHRRAMHQAITDAGEQR